MITKEDLKNLIGSESEEIIIKGKSITIFPTTKDLILFSITPGTKINIEEMTIAIKNVLKRSVSKGALPEMTDTEMDLFISRNFQELFISLGKVYGFLSNDDLEDVKKKMS